MTYPLRRRVILFKASRETVVLLACATAFTFALSRAAHLHPEAAANRDQAVQQGRSGQQGWTGQLADVSQDAASPRAAEPLTSASLVVPPAALPSPVAPTVGAPPSPGPAAVAARQAAPKPRPCDQPSCAPVKLGPPMASPMTSPLALPAAPPPTKPVARVEPAPPAGEKDDPGLINRLNPLKHLPDAVRHPFDYAGDAVSGWIKRL